MARYTVIYRDEGTFIDRDARWFRVSVLKEHNSLGIALGVIAEPDWEAELPGGGDGPAVLSNAAVRLLAIKIQEAVETGRFRDRWEVSAAELTLAGSDARHLVDTGVAEARRYSKDAAVAFFQH